MLASRAHEEAETAFRGFDAADGRRIAHALNELAEELARRGSGDPGVTREDDPNQLPLVRNPCCDDTGFADYAAVPCPNPKCTAVLRNLVEAGESISEQAQRLLDNERV